jgi:UDP-3-O-[3-hydroxymyristoyl] glucosamine N-acyltransferase
MLQVGNVASAATPWNKDAPATTADLSTMSHTIAEIAHATGLTAVGDTSLQITRPAEPGLAGAGDLALAMSAEYEAALSTSPARAAILREGADWQALDLKAALFAPRVRVALAGISEMFAPLPDLEAGIHPSAVIHPTARIGEDAWIGPFSVIGANARIGADARIMAHVTIGREAILGSRALLHPGVRIGARVRIGTGFLAQPNACIGADGFSFVTPKPGAVESARATGGVADDALNTSLRRIHSLGSIEIGDDVEIGAGTMIDRGTVSDTTIGNGTKIDNLVQIGHNVRIGRTCLICGQVGIAGSTEIGDRVVMGGKSGVSDHLKIGSDSVIAGGCLVGASVPPQSVMIGAPALPREAFNSQLLALRRLPRLIEQIRELRQKLGL